MTKSATDMQSQYWAPTTDCGYWTLQHNRPLTNHSSFQFSHCLISHSQHCALKIHLHLNGINGKREEREREQGGPAIAVALDARMHFKIIIIQRETGNFPLSPPRQQRILRSTSIEWLFLYRVVCHTIVDCAISFTSVRRFHWIERICRYLNALLCWQCVGMLGGVNRTLAFHALSATEMIGACACNAIVNCNVITNITFAFHSCSTRVLCVSNPFR